MTLREQIEADAITVFLNTGEFAELVTYYPHRFYGESAREPRSISAIVVREQIEVLSEDVITNAPSFEVHVANSSTLGISSDEIDTGGDQIEFPPRDGKTAERRTITRLVTQDNGMLILECR
jgi:hypothetical protein